MITEGAARCAPTNPDFEFGITQWDIVLVEMISNAESTPEDLLLS
jgi:hypothetical protein